MDKTTITVQVIEALSSPEVLGKLIPILSDKISESITDSINSSVEASIKALMDEHIIPLKQTLKEQQKRIDEQKEMISKQAHLVVQRIQEEQHLEKDKEIDSLHDIVNNLEVRLEHQEQYSRRTSLRFHNIDVPVDDRGHPVNTDDIISAKINLNKTSAPMTLAGRMLLVKLETGNIKSLLDYYHTDVAKKCITPKEISKMMPTESSSQKT